MKRRGPQADVMLRLYDDAWQSWELSNGSPRMLGADAPAPGGLRTLAVPARQVVASPLWIDGTDPALAIEAAKLELEVRGLLSRVQGMQGVSLRLRPEENRTLAVAAVFSAELPDSFPAADRFDASPFLLALPSDAATLWREGDDYVVAFTRGSEVVYWETADRSAGADELRNWLSLVVRRLEGEGVLAGPPRIVSWIEGVPAERLAPAGSLPFDEPAANARGVAGAPSLDRVAGDWKPASAHRAEIQRGQRERVRGIILAIAAGYLILAAALVLYAGILRWKASRLAAETSGLLAQVETFAPIRGDWNLIEPTVDPAQFPLSLLGGVVGSLPKGNIHLTKFIIQNDRLIVEGESDSFALATDFYNSLAGSESLRGIVWSGNTTPAVGATVTSFHAEGVLPLPEMPAPPTPAP